jgi:hypothetical protein
MKKPGVGSALAIIVFMLLAVNLFCQKRIYSTRHINPHPPKIDGELTDEVWQKGDWAGNFIQRSPYEGETPQQKTQFKILYDEKYLYVAIKAYDSEPDKVVCRKSRRDNIEGDYVTVNIDSYYDQRSAFTFIVSAAGVKGDEAISENGDVRDKNWDPVWQVKTDVNREGWHAEMRIPFSQLRFSKDEELVWGLQVSRLLFRKEEESGWQHIPRDSSGLVHQFGILKGLKGIKQGSKVELMPYMVGKMHRFEPEMGNPFASGKLSQAIGGIDGKIAITSDLTLDFTVNPDFGQVEADPSQVNLTAFETYFDEKRPFFIEGKNIFNYRLMLGNGDFSQDNLFYSRRIGRSPQHYPDTQDNEYVDMPENTSILGAFKLTGKTKGGLSIGIIESVTANERAIVGDYNQQREETVEPLTNYLGLRIQQDFNGGNTILGGMVTGVHRQLKDASLNFLHKGAYSGGIDLYHSWNNKNNFLSLKLAFSHVYGDKEAITRTQESPLRYFQRPDAQHVSFDPNRTSLSGYGGNFVIGKTGNGKLRYLGGITWRSPGLELNDMGYLRNADVIMQFGWMGYRITKPFGIFRRIGFNLNQWQGWDFSKERTFKGGNVGFFTQLKNYWTLSSSVNLQGNSITKSMLRGGPSVSLPGGHGYWFNLDSDSRKKLQFSLGGGLYNGKCDSRSSKTISAGVTFIPNNSISISVRPRYNSNNRQLQYMDTLAFNSEKRYILGSINQKTLSFTCRLNVSITPELTIQIYAQPFVSTGKYYNFKQITTPRALIYTDRFVVYNNDQLSWHPEDNSYKVDEDLDGISDYGFENPNFNFLQFRSNLVIRWEYKPGSAIYAVWSQGRTSYENTMDINSFENNIQNLFNLPPHNVFLIKFSHRLRL